MLKRPLQDYETVTRTGQPASDTSDSDVARPRASYQGNWSNDHALKPTDNTFSPREKSIATRLTPSHKLSFAFLFLFTIVLYARPSEFYPSVVTNSIALVIGIITLAFFIPTQLLLEGNLTAPMREVNLVLLFCLTALLSIPLAINPYTAWQEFSGTFIRCIVIFIVMINVTRSETRLKALLLVALAAGIWLSLGAINDFRLGLMTVEGYRARGRGAGIFGNPNDMALYLVSMVPIALALAFNARTVFRKLIFAGCALSLVIAIGLSYSRGGFLGLIVALGFFALRIAPRRKLEVLVGGGVLLVILLAAFPSYALRLASIVAPSLDPVGSSELRQGELLRSLYVAVRHPILGIGMDNYRTEMSYNGAPTHNSYTQVASEMGMAALVLYTMFIVTPLKQLGQIARETFKSTTTSRFYYLAIGLQAALLGYMVSSFFANDAYQWYVYYLVAYAISLRRLYESETGRLVVVERLTDSQNYRHQTSPSVEQKGAVAA
jgi:O-antigen ligase